MTTRFLAGMRLTGARLDELLNPPTFLGRATAVQSIGNSAFVAVTLGFADVDTHGGWSAGAPTRYVCQLSGMYEVAGCVPFTTSGTGGRGMVVRLNGTTYIRGSGTFVAGAATTITAPAGAPRPLYLNQGDYVELMAYQHSGGGSLDTFLSVDQAACLSVRRVRGSA